MAIEFKLPEVSEGVESADIAEILVSEGDVIEADQIVMEVETEKAVVELPCPHAGKITKIHVSEGDSVDVGAVLLSIEASEPAEKKESPSPKQDGGEKREQPRKTDKEPEKAEATSQAEREPAMERAGWPDMAKGLEEHGDHDPAVATEATRALVWREEQIVPPPPAAPSTRRLARELNVDLTRVQGSGAGGRITQDDVKAYVRSKSSVPKTQDVSASDGGTAQPAELREVRPDPKAAAE